MKIREIKNTDYVYIARMLHDQFVNDYYRITRLRITRKESVNYILNYLKREKRKGYVAIDNYNIVGIVIIKAIRCGLFEIEQLFLKPKFKNKGIGSLLIKHAIIYIKKRYSKTFLLCAQNNIKAHLFYKKNNFIKNRKTYFCWCYHKIPAYEYIII